MAQHGVPQHQEYSQPDYAASFEWADHHAQSWGLDAPYDHHAHVWDPPSAPCAEMLQEHIWTEAWQPADSLTQETNHSIPVQVSTHFSPTAEECGSDSFRSPTHYLPAGLVSDVSPSFEMQTWQVPEARITVELPQAPVTKVPEMRLTIELPLPAVEKDPVDMPESVSSQGRRGTPSLKSSALPLRHGFVHYSVEARTKTPLHRRRSKSCEGPTPTAERERELLFSKFAVTSFVTTPTKAELDLQAELDACETATNSDFEGASPSRPAANSQVPETPQTRSKREETDTTPAPNSTRKRRGGRGRGGKGPSKPLAANEQAAPTTATEAMWQPVFE